MSPVARLFAVIFVLLVVFSSAPKAQQSLYPADVRAVLDSAGENRSQLEQVLSHYLVSSRDPLLYKAACYLIGNMAGHSYVTFKLVDTSDNEIPFNVQDYPNFDSLLVAADSLETQHGSLDFKRKDITDDYHVITADYLINQIEYAFKAWREKPWAKNLSFDDFCAYVLPYRSSNEPLEPWREFFWEKYKDIDKQMKDPADPIEAAAIINDDVKSWFTFDPRWYYHPTDQGLAEMRQTHLGRCEDMTNLAIYAMRANGLAVTSDYTPYWANSGNNHAWNAIVKPDGTVIPFMGAEANPGTYHLANKFAKVYRKTFGRQPGNLVFRERKQDKIPGWLAGKSYVDVTSEYTNTVDATIALTKDVPDSVDIAYLCVFNSGEWKPIDWARIENNSAHFTNFAPDIACLPALYINEKIEPREYAFTVDADGIRHDFAADTANTFTGSLVSTTKRKQEISTDGIAKSSLTPGQEYELFYWSDGWQSLGRKTADDGPLVYDNMPTGALFWLVADNSDREERIFTIAPDGTQTWW